MFRAAALVQSAYLRSSAQVELFCPNNAQLVAAAATFITAFLDDKTDHKSISLTDLSHSMDNRWSPDDIWSCVKIMLTLHADTALGEPTLLDFILVYFCHDEDNPVEADVTRRTVTLAMLAAASTTLTQDYPARITAACVCCLARFSSSNTTAAAVEIWSDALAVHTGLDWPDLPLTEARTAIQEVLQTPHLLMCKFAQDLTSVAHLNFLPTAHDLDVYRHRHRCRSKKRARVHE